MSDLCMCSGVFIFFPFFVRAACLVVVIMQIIMMQ